MTERDIVFKKFKELGLFWEHKDGGIFEAQHKQSQINDVWSMLDSETHGLNYDEFLIVLLAKISVAFNGDYPELYQFTDLLYENEEFIYDYIEHTEKTTEPADQ